MARLIGTAGHVDHGKTTLIRALTGIDADRLPEEKARGMTIDIGFAFLDLPGHGRVSIVDVPGHERFIHNMLVGALGVDVALLCVAADEGVKPQTREHLEILDLLPVDRMVVAMTRADLADDETRQLAEMDVRDALEDTRFADSPVLPVSAVTGEGIERLKEALSQALDGSQEAEPGPWYLPIDRAFAVKGHGTVVTGTLAQGVAKVGQVGFLEPGHVEVRIRALHSHGEALEQAESGRRVAMNLGGVKLEDVERGMVVGESGAAFETACFDARIRWTKPSKHGQRVRVSIGAAEVMGKAFVNDLDPELVQFRLDHPVAAALRQPVVVRRHSPMEVMGGGCVVVPQAKTRKKSEQVKVIEAQTDDQAIVQVVSAGADGVATDEICRLLGKTPQALGPVFEQLAAQGEILGFAGRWLTPATFEKGVARLLDALGKLHRDHPRTALHPREKVVSMAGLAWAGKPLDRILARLVEERILVLEGTSIRDATFSIQLSDKQRVFLDRVKSALESAGINVPTPLELARLLGVPPQAIDEIIKLGIEARELVRVEDGIFYTSAQLGEFRKLIRGLPSPFAASDFRDSAGSSRRYVIPLLEYFDSVGITLRQGDRRVIR